MSACISTKCPERLLALGGITRIHGYSVDSNRQDIVLIGTNNAEVPALRLDDFVVALRNVWLKYAPVQGNTILVSAPGCSIDPDPKIIQELRQLKGAGLTNDAERWNAVCRGPQQVRIFGVPADVHFSQVMVKADYDMKRVTNGMDMIPGLDSLSDMRFREYENAVAHGRDSVISQGGNRFWFAPGSIVFNANAEGAVLEELEVRLLTESDRLKSSSGERIIDPLARRFAAQFTKKFSEASSRYPIYRELENLFRFVALAKMLKMRAVEARSGLTLDVLRDEFPVPTVSVSRTLPGIPSMRTFQREERQRVDGGTLVKTTRGCIPTCGGVSMEIKDTNMKATDQSLPPFFATASQRRPSDDSVFWELQEMR